MKLYPKPKSWGGEPSIWAQCQLYLRIREGGGGGERAGSASDLPPCCWLPLFAHSVNYYQKAVYLGCSPMLLHILWPIIKGDLHYKPWSPSKKATVSAWRPIPALQHYQEHSLLICVPVLLRLSFLPFPSLGPLLPLSWFPCSNMHMSVEVCSAGTSPTHAAFYNPFYVCIHFLWCGCSAETGEKVKTSASPEPASDRFSGSTPSAGGDELKVLVDLELCGRRPATMGRACYNGKSCVCIDHSLHFWVFNKISSSLSFWLEYQKGCNQKNLIICLFCPTSCLLPETQTFNFYIRESPWLVF